MCAVTNQEFQMLTNRVVLKANLKLIWNAGIFDTPDQSISHVNLRYAGYRTLFGWIW